MHWRSSSERSWEAQSPQAVSCTDHDSGMEDGDEQTNSPPVPVENSTIYVAFKGNMTDEDFQTKLNAILNGIPDMLLLGQSLVQTYMPSSNVLMIRKLFTP